MRSGARLLAALLGLTLVASTCAGDASDLDAAVEGPVAVGDGEAPPADLDDLASVQDLVVSPAIIAPGDTVEVTVVGHARDAEVRITSGDHEVAVAVGGASSVEVSIPETAPDGLHRVRVEQEGAILALGEVRVASEPGIWVRADRRYVGPDDVVTLTVSAHGIPLDTPAVLIAPPEFADPAFDDDWADWGADGEDREDEEPWGDDEEPWWLEEGAEDDWDWREGLDEEGRFDLDRLREEAFEEAERQLEQEREDLEADQDPVVFAVHDSGWIVPLGPSQLLAGELPTLGELVDAPILVPGHLAAWGGFGVVLDREAATRPVAELVPSTARLAACDEPGMVAGQVAEASLVEALSLDGPLRSARTETSGGYQLEAGPGPVLITVTPLDDEGEETIEVVDVPCGATTTLASAATSSAGIVQASFVSPGQRPVPAVPVGAGGGAGGEVCRHAFVRVARYNDDPLFSARLAAAVQDVLLAGLPRVTVATQDQVQAVVEQELREQLWAELVGEGDATGEGMRYADRLMDADILVLVSPHVSGRRFTAYMSAFDREQRNLASAVETGSVTGVQRLTRSASLRAFAQDIGRSMICAEIEPAELHIAPDDTEDLELTVTDLRGEGADGAEVTVTPEPECGELEPPAGERTVSDETLTFTYEATERSLETCEDRLRFEVLWPDGEPQPVEDTVRATITVGGRFHVEMDVSVDPRVLIEAGVPALAGYDAAFEARNCDGGGILGPWEGELAMDGELLGILVGHFTVDTTFDAGFTLPERGGRFDPGLGLPGIAGEFFHGGNVMTLTSDGHYWMVGQVRTLDDDEPC